MADPFEEQKATSGTLATIVFVATTAYLFVSGPGFGSVFTLRGVGFIVIGMFAAAIAVGIPMYILGLTISKLFVMAVAEPDSKSSTAAIHALGVLLLLVHVGVTIFVTNVAFGYVMR